MGMKIAKMFYKKSRLRPLISRAVIVILIDFLNFSSAFCEGTGARDYYLRGDWKRAVEGFYAAGLQNLSVEEVKELSMSLYFLGRFEEAGALIRPFIDKDEQALVIYYLAISDKKTKETFKGLSGLESPHAITARAMILKNREPEEALRLLNEAIAREQDHFWAWFYRGLILEEREDFMNAAKAYKNALRLNPFFAQAHNNLGYCYKESHYYSWAVEEYLKAIELIPDNAGYYYNLGNAYTHLEKIEEAFNAYKKAVELDPSFAKAHYNLARTYLRKDMVREAIEEFRLYLKYGNREVFNFVAPEDAVREEIEQLEEYLRLYGPAR